MLAIELLAIMLLIQLYEVAVESMQVAALSPALRVCSRQVRGAVSGIFPHRRPTLSFLAASRTYHANRPFLAENALEDADSGPQHTNKRLPDPIITARDHPLSIRALRNLAPKIPHIFTSRSTSPYFNLAVEHHLLTHSHSASHVLFTYTNTPCVVIGRNQNPWVECDIAAIIQGTSDGRKVELIRRRSGGGTVFHDEGNLNYSVIVPGEGFERNTHVQMVIDALAWLCDKRYMFRRWKEVKTTERNDIVASLLERFRAEGSEEEWFKVSGTAFKLTRGRALHHGTLLHSSPYINSIGSLLRSPGKENITAKGVESVRSPVMNLWGTKNAKKRKDLAWTIRKTIQQKWVEKYAIDPVDEIQAIEVADGGIEDLIPELKAGIEELQTDAWRWEQTPGFTFDSKDAGSDGKTVRLAFEVKNGLIQSVETSTELRPRYEETLAGKKIHEISEPGGWREALTDESLSERNLERLVSLLEKCFPPVKRNIQANETGQTTSSDIQPIAHVNDHQIGTRFLQWTDLEGIVEVESQGSNALVQIEPGDMTRRRPRSSPENWDNIRLRNIGSSARRLTSRLARWKGQASRLNMNTLKPRLPSADREARGMRHAKQSYTSVFRNLTETTIRINIEILRLQERIADMLAGPQGQALRQIKLHQNVADELDGVSAQIRGLDLDLMRFLTTRLAEQKKKTARVAARTSIRADPLPLDEEEEIGDLQDVDSERLSGSQKILEATLQMINEEDTRKKDMNDFST